MADVHARLVLLALILAASLALMLWRPRGISEAWWVGGGVLLLLALRLLSLRAAGRAVARGTDVYLFLTGMMLVSELAREHGVFDWLAGDAVRLARGSRARLFLLIYGAGALTTALLSNDATAVVMTPAVLAALKKTHDENDSTPFLFACAMVANAAGFLLPISNPGNLVVFQKHLPPLGHWLGMFLLPCLAAILTTFLALRFWFRSALRKPMERLDQTGPLSRSGRWVLGGIGMVAAVLLIASAVGWQLGLPTCLAALVMVAVVSVAAQGGVVHGVRKLLQGVSWSVLPLVAGLFCLLEAAERAGLTRVAVHALRATEAWPRSAGVFGLGMGVGLLTNLVNNLPVGLLASAAVQGAHVHGPRLSAVLIGVDLGPNLSVTGSLATILWLMRIRREGTGVSGLQFLRVGLLVMPAAMAAALGVLLLVGR